MREVYTELVRLCSVYFPEYKAELIEDEGYLMVDLRKGG
jgi:hypothetical protein